MPWCITCSLAMMTRNSRKKLLTSVERLKSCWVPLCWKAFLENTTPHQQHWAGSVQVSPSNYLSAIGQHYLSAADVKMPFVQIILRKVNDRGENSNSKRFARQYTPCRVSLQWCRWHSLAVMADGPLPPTLLQGHMAWSILSGKAFTIND